MTIALVDSVSQATIDSPVNLITATLPGGAPNAGDLLVCSAWRDLSVGANGNRITRAGWTGVTVQNVGPDLANIDMLYRVAQTGDPAAMQFDWGGIGGSASKLINVTRWSGPWGATPFDSESVGTFGVASPSQDHAPTSSVEALILLQACYQGGSSGTPGTGLIEQVDSQITGSNPPRSWLGYRIETSTSGTYACGLTWGNCCFSGSTLRVISFIAVATGGAEASSTKGMREHRHHAGQIVTRTAENSKFIRDHGHRADQVYGTPTSDKERAMGKRHLHTDEQVS